MPELPEVETARAYVEEFCGGSTIVKCIAHEQGGGPRDGLFDDIVIGEDVTADSVRSSFEGRIIVDLKRRGKQMWFVLDKPPHALFHFGMTGAFTVKGEKRHKFVKFKVGEEWPPKFTKIEFQMSNGACLALTDPRRLARVRLRTDPETQPPISLLGPDPVTHPLTLEEFAAALAKPTAPIKAVLLAQDRVVSGVGNWIADEVCFQARVHPGAPCNTLAADQVGALHSKLLSVCREACAARADYTVFPEEWLFHHRWGKGKAADGAPRVSSGDPIHFDVVGGRTTAFVPALQKKGTLSPATGSKKTAVRAKAEGKGKPKGKAEGKAKAKVGSAKGVKANSAPFTGKKMAAGKRKSIKKESTDTGAGGQVDVQDETLGSEQDKAKEGKPSPRKTPAAKVASAGSRGRSKTAVKEKATTSKLKTESIVAVRKTTTGRKASGPSKVATAVKREVLVVKAKPPPRKGSSRASPPTKTTSAAGKRKRGAKDEQDQHEDGDGSTQEQGATSQPGAAVSSAGGNAGGGKRSKSAASGSEDAVGGISKVENGVLGSRGRVGGRRSPRLAS